MNEEDMININEVEQYILDNVDNKNLTEGIYFLIKKQLGVKNDK